MYFYDHQVKLICLKQCTIYNQIFKSVPQDKRTLFYWNKEDINIFFKLNKPYSFLSYLSDLFSDHILLLHGQALSNNKTNIHVILTDLLVCILFFYVDELLDSLASDYNKSAFLFEDAGDYLHQVLLTFLFIEIEQIYLSFKVRLNLFSHDQSSFVLLITLISQECCLIVLLSSAYLNRLELVKEAIASYTVTITQGIGLDKGFQLIFLINHLMWMFQLSPLRYAMMQILEKLKEIELFEATMKMKVFSIFNLDGLS